MAERFFVADTHFGHAGMCQFEGTIPGVPLRPWGRIAAKGEMSPAEVAERVEAMDQALVERWNAVVGPKDKVEHLGDVVINRRALSTLDRLNGKKRLRLGNHDLFLKDYGRYFQEVSAYKVMDDLICSHIPLHVDSVKERWKANVHGHLHDRRVMTTRAIVAPSRNFAGSEHRDEEIANPRYLCVSVEHTDYTPIPLDEVYRRIAEQQEGL